MSLLKGLSISGSVRCGEPLCRHTTFRIGGPVELFAEPADIDDLAGIREFSRGEGIDIALLGGGSNILAADYRINKLAVCMGKHFNRIVINQRSVSCGAGCGLQQFISKALAGGYGGLEFMAGIPGSVGGAVAMNAGKGKDGPWISKFIKAVKVMDRDSKVYYLRGGELKFGYRESNLNDFIVLEAEFELKDGCDKTALKNEYRRILADKMEKQELSLPSAGCIFRNPVGTDYNAGQLIDECGLKGKRIGDAAVSMKHANFIVNMGKATFTDVTALIELIKGTVKKKRGIALELEIKILN